VAGSTAAVVIVTHAAMHEHAPRHNREVPQRLIAALRGVAAARRSGVVCEMHNAEPVQDAEVLAVHAPALLEQLRSAFAQGLAQAGPEAPLDAGTWSSASHAAGAGPTAVRRLVQAGAPRRAFCVVRPPGHHASHDAASGYCYLNNAAITAAAVRSLGLAQRVAILDIDHHHGNGTEALVGRIGACAYASVHAAGYPGTGLRDGAGAIFNRVLRRMDRAAWRQAVAELLAQLRAWRPEALVLSFGTDALIDDPVGDLGITQDDLDGAVRDMVAQWPPLPMISLLEGGYSLPNLEEAVRRHVRTLAGAT